MCDSGPRHDGPIPRQHQATRTTVAAPRAKKSVSCAGPHRVVWIEDRDQTNDPESKWQVAADVARDGLSAETNRSKGERREPSAPEDFVHYRGPLQKHTTPLLRPRTLEGWPRSCRTYRSG